MCVGDINKTSSIMTKRCVAVVWFPSGCGRSGDKGSRDFPKEKCRFEQRFSFVRNCDAMRGTSKGCKSHQAEKKKETQEACVFFMCPQMRLSCFEVRAWFAYERRENVRACVPVRARVCC